MAEVELRSTQFRRERERSWAELERLLERSDVAGPSRLSPDDLARLPMLYRATLSSLSVARSISLDRSLLLYLESLATRAYLSVYAAHSGLPQMVGRFFAERWPACVRAAGWHILVSALCLAVGIGVGLALTLESTDWFYAFVDADMAAGRTPAASTEDLRAALYTAPDAAHELSAFAAFLFSHNSQIGMLCFALGFAFGVPTVLLLFVNGLGVGAFVALYADRGLGGEMIAWLTIHGTTELFAIVLCGAAGLVVAESLVFPGRHARLHNLARRGRDAAVLVIGAVVMLFAAALLEGLGRQLINDPVVRILVGTAALAAWLGYFALAGRGSGPGGGRGGPDG
ncbi:MAG: stage II sporulation protein M [Alphaproteobacteria bacterium]